MLSQSYIERIDDKTMADYLSTALIKLITDPRRTGKSVLALQLLSGQSFAYLNFDDDQLLKNFDEDAVLQALVEGYKKYDFCCLMKFRT
ncbi:MAG TPA: hypothetical protein ENN08_07030 [Bacteroidales bacterium]|nr:hypothetical protein [Bacteroidales bacterium]